MPTARSCPQCGEALGAREYADGTVWECARHGVRAWIFDAPSLAFVRPAPRAAPRASTGTVPVSIPITPAREIVPQPMPREGVAGPISPII